MKKAFLLLLLAFTGCTSYPTCTWIEVSAERLASECNDWDVKLRGCQKGTTTCELYVLKPEK